jgi:sRNA-binding carbon storage regulator CsrA
MQINKVVEIKENIKPVTSTESGFLCITRKTRPDQNTILINEGEMEIRVLSIQGNAVRLGFRATKDFKIDRPDHIKKV